MDSACTMNTLPSPRPAVPQLIAVKRWSWAGWYARWDWRYLSNGWSRPHTKAGIIRRYAERLGYARVHDLMGAAEAAYREPRGGGIPFGIFAGRGVLVHSATSGRHAAIPHGARHDHHA